MRTEVEFKSLQSTIMPEWRARLMAAIGQAANLGLLAACGFTADLLAYCGVTILDVVYKEPLRAMGVVDVQVSHTIRYPLEHVIDAFELSFDDLCLLGFQLAMLHQKTFFPLIVLYDKCQFRAETLFRFEIGWTDLQRLVLNVDARYASLLKLNLPWLQKVLTPPPVDSATAPLPLVMDSRLLLRVQR